MRIVGIAVAVLLAGCAGSKARATFSQPGNGEQLAKVEVESASGNVRIAGGAPFEVVGTVHVEDSSDERAHEIAQRIAKSPPIELRGDRARIGDLSKYGGPIPRSVSIDYQIRAPGEVEVKVETASGDVEVSDVRGPVALDIASGDARITNVEGDVEVDTASGDVHVAGARGRVTLNSASGDITVTGAPAEGTRWVVDTASGDVVLTVPPNASFRLRADTSSGSIRFETPVQIQGDLSGDHIDGTVGDNPSATIEVSTSSGDVVFREGAPAKAHARR